jgi:hypothetical protein
MVKNLINRFIFVREKVLTYVWVTIYLILLILKEMKKWIVRNFEIVVVGGLFLIVGLLSYVITTGKL